ncbi:hypothetical protein [Faecalicoccus pleomorphus]|uniref:hypothetical protein n=1 Tax=Faecalicoccus pleomorphus TaxID=1323 RepID=UPI00189ACA01|nr:hypothetical protein [Faecalicoccus pleomorphus]MDB7983739.1 hypothetical protein [Faecalicoccus pleomorphus]
MEYIGVGICVMAMVAICIFVIQRKKNNQEANPSEDVKTGAEEHAITVSNDAPEELVIEMEMLPAEVIKDESALVEITDSKVLAHVNNLVPGLAQAGNAANNAAQAIQANGEVLYRAILPAGAKLSNSRTLEGAVKEMYHGANGIKGHADWLPVEAHKGSAVAANTAAAAMGVASMVVGQYYMTQINAELGAISDGISEIQNFQDNEYRSRVFSLVAHVKKIADFQTEILENNELRISKINQLDSLEEECTQLLGQANLTLAGFAKKTDLDYEAYEKVVGNAQSWFMYQKSLLDVLYKISDLRYTLHLGAVSREQCIAILPIYTKQVQDTQSRLAAWHEGTTERLKIDTDEVRRKRAGFDGVIHFLPGLFDEDFNYRSIEKSTANMIRTQASGDNTLSIDKSELYLEDVQLIAKDGKIYYLPKNR